MPDWTFYGALVVAALAAVSALAYAVTQSLLAWRALKRLRRHASKELERIASLAETASEKAARSADSTRLEASLARLRVGLARLTVLREAIDDVTGTVGRVTAFYPRK